MKRPLHITALCLAMLAGACTQDPALVDYRGDAYYGRVHEGALDSPDHETYPEDSPRIKKDYARPVPPTPVQPVGVTDLPPPAQQTHSQQMAALDSRPAVPPPAPRANRQQAAQFIWPVADGKVISHFGPGKGGRSNDGINISVAEGEPIWASADGTVVYSGSDLKGYGNMVIVRHDGGWMTAYAHARSLTVKKDAIVKQGDIIGYVGMSGGVPSPQLHFAIRDGRTPVDPELYLPGKSASAQ